MSPKTARNLKQSQVLGEEQKIKNVILDLAKVPHFSELAQTLGVNKLELKSLVDKLNAETTAADCTTEQKKLAMKLCADDLKPVLNNIKEGLRRIKAAGLKPSKGTESAAESSADHAGR